MLGILVRVGVWLGDPTPEMCVSFLLVLVTIPVLDGETQFWHRQLDEFFGTLGQVA